MKISKIIFISLLGTIALITLAGVIDFRIHGRRNYDIQAENKQSGINLTKQAVPSFKVLCVNNSKHVILVQSDSSFIEMTYPKDSSAPTVNYTIKGDTLMVSDINRWVKIHSPAAMNKICLKNTDINIESFVSGQLYLDMDQSHLWIRDLSKKSFIRTLDIVGKNHSRIDTEDFRVDSLGIVLQKSAANLNPVTKMMNSTLSDSSYVHIKQSGKISSIKDDSSTFSVN